VGAAATTLFAAGVGLAFVVALGLVFCAWFYAVLARQVEIALGTPVSEFRERGLFAELRDTAVNLFVLCALNVGCLLLNLVPGAGSVLATILGLYFTAFLFGLEYLDFPLALRGRNRREKLSFARRHRLVTLGLGSSVAVLNLVPGLGAIFLVAAVAGSVVLYHRRAGIGER